ncbi:hypothetical protein KIPB_007577 [Kipferlia bialata]|uniref:Uncharacterized protein n=1 Tax=Kipferlia bialata TaxID=797122 RepID=A0A391NKS9_9EUKA|nr:hypothetical protein KIPB_000962 [Kipferlia bialata]GCA62634.1 hypothetical protein KIPB_004777 [Kipferlia bialata]GCA63055.1 hypothetical protein KIPB_007577 [Kipferlia bialata]|eukprot:g962.t1
MQSLVHNGTDALWEDWPSTEGSHNITLDVGLMHNSREGADYPELVPTVNADCVVSHGFGATANVHSDLTDHTYLCDIHRTCGWATPVRTPLETVLVGATDRLLLLRISAGRLYLYDTVSQEFCRDQHWDRQEASMLTLDCFSFRGQSAYLSSTELLVVGHQLDTDLLIVRCMNPALLYSAACGGDWDTIPPLSVLCDGDKSFDRDEDLDADARYGRDGGGAGFWGEEENRGEYYDADDGYFW